MKVVLFSLSFVMLSAFLALCGAFIASVIISDSTIPASDEIPPLLRLPSFCLMAYEEGECMPMNANDATPYETLRSERWFYNSSHEGGTCQKFSYSGCTGNQNNFFTYEDCALACRNGSSYLYNGEVHAGLRLQIKSG